MTASTGALIVGINSDEYAAKERLKAYHKMRRCEPLTLAEKRRVTLYMAERRLRGEGLSGDDRVLLATLVAQESAAEVALIFFAAVCWELAVGFGPRVLAALDALVGGEQQ